MSRKEKKIGVIVHMYYCQSLELMKQQLTVFNEYNCVLFFNICSSSFEKENLYRDLRAAYPGAFIIETPNIGKDIGGKLAIIDLCVKLKIDLDYLIFLHDKKSPHSALGDVWRKKLFRIIEQENIESILKMFETNRKIGVVGAQEFIVNEYDKKTVGFNSTSNGILKELISKYELKLDTHDFIGGTMFWIRAELIISFFSRYSSLEIRSSLEKGNVLDYKKGTYTHAWERMLSWIATDSGYSIKGI
jgi:lipopolysaccharide biosynthesis protein